MMGLHRIDAIAIGVVVWLASAVGAYFWGEHRGAKVERAGWTEKVLAAEREGRAAERKLFDEQIAATGRLHQSLEDSIRATRSQADELRRQVQSWAARPVPVRIVRMLDAPASAPGRADSAAPAVGDPARGNDPLRDTAAIDPEVLAAAVRENAGRAERNIARLNQCIAAYDRAKGAIESFAQGRAP